MIIKGTFKRYERWNPVHPTFGAFWGMGIGVGCGVGWGPGFGPDVIGYVGAGCGVGFSVGFTVAGVGVGLPANYLFEVPYNAFMAARSSGLMSSKSIAGDWWTLSVPHVSDLQRGASGRLSSFKQKLLFEEAFNLFDAKNLRLGQSKSIWTSFGELHKQFFRGDKGPQD